MKTKRRRGLVHDPPFLGDSETPDILARIFATWPCEVPFGESPTGAGGGAALPILNTRTTGFPALASAGPIQHIHEMSTREGDERDSILRAAQFATTHWSIVLAAGAKGSPQAAEALEKLCRVYWYPLYAYVRRQGHGAHDAQDLTQAFFARLLEK